VDFTAVLAGFGVARTEFPSALFTRFQMWLAETVPAGVALFCVFLADYFATLCAFGGGDQSDRLLASRTFHAMIRAVLFVTPNAPRQVGITDR
jgi:hypothetical protein